MTWTLFLIDVLLGQAVNILLALLITDFDLSGFQTGDILLLFAPFSVPVLGFCWVIQKAIRYTKKYNRR
jgi:hypothetical protein